VRPIERSGIEEHAHGFLVRVGPDGDPARRSATQLDPQVADDLERVGRDPGSRTAFHAVAGDDDPPVVETLASRDPQPDRVAMSGQIQRDVAAALTQLSERERAAFVLRHLEGMSIERISEVLKIGPNAVKQTVFRAVQKLRRELAPLAGVA